MSPGETPPKKSPIMLPIADPHAAAGPNRNEQTIGIALAGRSSVTPGISGTTLNGTSTAAYSAAEIAHSTTIRVLRHIRRSSLIAECRARYAHAPCLLYWRRADSNDRQSRSSRRGAVSRPFGLNQARAGRGCYGDGRAGGWAGVESQSHGPRAQVSRHRLSSDWFSSRAVRTDRSRRRRGARYDSARARLDLRSRRSRPAVVWRTVRRAREGCRR